MKLQQEMDKIINDKIIHPPPFFKIILSLLVTVFFGKKTKIIADIIIKNAGLEMGSFCRTSPRKDRDRYFVFDFDG